jgi:hypothetical protein
MKFLSTNLSVAIFLFSLATIVRGQDDACADEAAAWDTCVEANPAACDTCAAAFLDASDVSSGGLDLTDPTVILDFLCTTLKSVGCVMQTCGCSTCSAEFDATMQCSLEAGGVANCDTTCASSVGGGSGGSSAPGALSANMMAPILFGSLMLLA